MGWIYPLNEWIITSSFGNRIHPITKDIKFHNGIDLRAKYVPLYSPGAGTVKKVYTSGPGGLTIIIEHSGGYESGFAHLDSSLVIPGQNVKAGEQIGITGNSGASTTAPHLHYRMKFNNDYIDPESLNYIYKKSINYTPWILSGLFLLFFIINKEKK